MPTQDLILFPLLGSGLASGIRVQFSILAGLWQIALGSGDFGPGLRVILPRCVGCGFACGHTFTQVSLRLYFSGVLRIDSARSQIPAICLI